MRACSWPSGPITTTITSPASTRFGKGKRSKAQHGQQVEPVCHGEMVTHRDVLNPGAVHGLPLAFDPIESKKSSQHDMRKAGLSLRLVPSHRLVMVGCLGPQSRVDWLLFCRIRAAAE